MARPAAASSRRPSPASRSSSSVTIDPTAVDPADVELLQDLVVAAVNDALRGVPRAGRGEDGCRDRRAAAARACRGARCRPPLIEPVARLIEAFARLPGHRPEDRPAADVPPLAGAGGRGPGAGRRPHRGPRRGRLLRALLQHQRRAALPDLPRPGRDHAGCASSRSRSTSWRSSGPASSRAATTSSTARSHRSTGSGPSASRSASCSPASTRPLATGEPFEEVDPGHEPDARGRGDGDVPRRAPRRQRRRR